MTNHQYLQPTTALRFPLGDNSRIILTRHIDGLFFVTWTHGSADGGNEAQGFLPHAVKHHSQDFETGYAGSGPADLALNILLAFFPTPPQPAPIREILDSSLDTELGGLGGLREHYARWETYEEETVRCDQGQRASRLAWTLHQPFKCQFLSMALATSKSQTISGRVIREWAYDWIEHLETEEYLAKAG